MAAEAKQDKDEDDTNKLNIDNNDEELKDNYPTVIDFKPLSDGSTNNPSYIVLMGDAMLDNFYYQMDKKKQSITSLLRNKYFGKAMITNLAVEGSESRHVQYGIAPNQILINERKKYSLEPYPIDHDEGNRVYPLAILEEMISTKSIKFDLPKSYHKPTVILSVGMMDIKTLIPIYDESQIFTQMLAFEKNLTAILKELVNKFKLNVILVSLWEPHGEFYSLYETPRDAFVMVLNMWMCKLFTIASDYNLPVMDLTRTLHCYERSHYSASSIFDNSTKSSAFIVDLIDYIFKDYDFNNKKQGYSMIYYSSHSYGGIKKEENDIKARNGYMNALKSQSAFKDVKKDASSSMDDEKKQYNDNDDDEKKVDHGQKKVLSSINDNDKAKVEDKDNDNNKDQDKNKKDEKSKSKPTHIILMGDSVLDNFYWLKDKKKDVKQQILDTYDNKIKVTNLAVDESTSEDVFYGTDPSWTYVDARKEYGLEPYPIDKNNNDKVCPLDIAKKMITNKEINLEVGDNEIKPTVVLSVGGNDIRVLLFNFNDQVLLQGLQQLQTNLEGIVDKVLFDLKLNLIPVICYEPYHDFAPGFGIKREQLLQVFGLGVPQIFQLCETYSLPVIDLSRTFNPFDRTHYGSTSIEPSNKSGQYIVDLIQEINNKFPFNSNNKTSKIYYGLKSDKDGIIEQENNDAARQGYLAQLLARKPPSDDNAGQEMTEIR